MIERQVARRDGMERSSRRVFIRFSVIEALFFAIFAIATYQTVYLQETGLSSSQIGMVVSIASVAGLMIVPVWGIISDVYLSAKATFLISITATAVIYFVMPLLGNAVHGAVGFFYIFVPLIYLFRQPSNSMLDSWGVGELTPLGIGYGRVRMFGSIGYSVASILLGMCIGELFEVDFAFYLMLPLALVLLLICRSGKGSAGAAGKGKKEQKGKFSISLLTRNPAFIMYLIYAFGLNIYLSVTLIFMPYILTAANCEAGQIGLVTGFRALMEIFSMYVGSRLAKKMRLSTVMVIPGILFGLEQMLYQFADGIFSILLIMVLSGLAGGFFYSLGPSYIHEIVPEEVSATAQTCNAMVQTLVGIIGTAAGGCMINMWGIHVLTNGCCILIFTLTVLFIVSLRVTKRKENIK